MSQNIKTNLFYSLAVISLATLIITSAIYAWTEPSLAPPDGNVSAPINAGDAAQIKTDPLQVNGFRNIGDTIFDGTVGIGTTIPTTALTMGADKSFRLIGGASFPASPNEGEIFFRTDNKQLYTYASSTWQADRTIASKIVAASNSLNKEKADYVCDGTDDQEQIQQAIDDLGTNGGAVYLLEGTFNISASINLNNTAPDDSGKAIIGAGAGTVLKLVSGASGVVAIFASNVNRILISQLMIDGNNKTGDTNYGIAFYDTVTYSKIDNVWVKELNDGAGVYLYLSSYNNITANAIQNNIYAILLESSCNNNTITGNNLQGNEFGIQLNSSSNNNVITANTVGGNEEGISLNSCNNNTITANNMVKGIHIYSNSNNNIITANLVQGSEYNGMNVGSSYNNIISVNTVSGSVGDGIGISNLSSNNSITGNIIYENGSDGIDMGNVDNNLIFSNRIYDSSGAGYGINIDGNCDNNYLIGNFIDGAGFTAPIQDLGASTKYTDKTKMTLEQAAALTINNDSTITPSSPTSYQLVKGNGAATANAATPIAQGKAAGDILILQGDPSITTNIVTIPNSGNVKLGASRALAANDTLSLVWNGTYWVETGYSDN